MAEKRKEGISDRNGEYKKRRTMQKGQISGPGILLTTVRRKERKAGLELIEFLEDLVVELYPDLDLSVSIPEPSKDTSRGYEYDDDDDFDALVNGVPPSAAESSSSIEKAAETESESMDKLEKERLEEEEDDIEAKIKAELEGLRPKRRHNHMNGQAVNHLGSKADHKPTRRRFSLMDPEVECLMFVSVAWPMDPVRLCCALLEQVSKTGQVRGHFIQRLSPMYSTGRADCLDRIEKVAMEVMERHFPESDKPSTYKVEPKLRLHHQLHKMEIIKTVASAVPAPHHADLNNPDLIINVEVLKMTIGIGILPHYEKYKRYNPQMIAQAYNKDDSNIDELASRTLLPK